MFTDSHCHLTGEYYDDISKELEDAKKNSVTRLINIGCDSTSMKEVIATTSKHKNIYCAIGIHPNELGKSIKQDYEYLKKHLNECIAIGEIGLDYHYEHDKKAQKLWFEKQLDLAQETNKPVIIHSRDATKDTIDILKKYKLKGIVHSFSGSYETALEYIKLGYILGINGVITFKNSKLSDVISKLSLEYIVLETDAPFLTPHPYRGEKNSPKHIKIIAEYISNLKGISLEELGRITNENLKRVFDI